jgi:hypothetical protein
MCGKRVFKDKIRNIKVGTCYWTMWVGSKYNHKYLYESGRKGDSKMAARGRKQKVYLLK